MGIGDEVMATGFARGAADRGKQIAFGDGRRLVWGPWCAEAFQGNPNIANVVHGRVEWVDYYKGKRHYNKADGARERWIWNYQWKAPRGQFYFTDTENAFAVRRPNAVLLEPNLPWHKSVAPNKDWGLSRWQRLADELQGAGFAVWQPKHGRDRLRGINVLDASSFRETAAAMSGFDLVIVPEGGLHHAAAAVGVPAIVIFGGFIPPQVTGYDGHVNLTGGAEACGSWKPCEHCRKALAAIEVEGVYGFAKAILSSSREIIAASA